MTTVPLFDPSAIPNRLQATPFGLMCPFIPPIVRRAPEGSDHTETSCSPATPTTRSPPSQTTAKLSAPGASSFANGCTTWPQTALVKLSQTANAKAVLTASPSLIQK